MTKNDLVAAVSESTGLNKSDAGRAVDAVFDSITEALACGDSVRLVGFGTFMVVHRAASKGRNPRTNEPIDIPALNLPKFKAGRSLKDAVAS